MKNPNETGLISRKPEEIDLCFDLDGVLADSINGDYENAAPIQYGIDQINKAYDLGYNITIFTARFGKRHPGEQYQYGYELTIRWLRKHSVRFHKLVLAKPAYDLVCDDKAVRIESEASWDTFWKELEKVKYKDKYNQPIKNE